MKKFILAATAVSALAMSTSALAADKKEPINAWKHCGIGAMIFDDNSTAAAISNIIWDLGTTALSSKISSDDSCEGKRVKVAQLIQDNFNTVMEQTSAGEGEHLTAIMTMLDVPSSKQADAVASVRNQVAGVDNVHPEAYYNAVIASI